MPYRYHTVEIDGSDRSGNWATAVINLQEEYQTSPQQARVRITRIDLQLYNHYDGYSCSKTDLYRQYDSATSSVVVGGTQLFACTSVNQYCVNLQHAYGNNNYSWSVTPWSVSTPSSSNVFSSDWTSWFSYNGSKSITVAAQFSWATGGTLPYDTSYGINGSKSISLYAMPVIKYNGNAQGGGTVSNVPGNQSISEDSSFTITSTKPTHSTISTNGTTTITGYGNGGKDVSKSATTVQRVSRSFSRWNTNSSGSGTSFYSGSSYSYSSISGAMSNKVANLYAIWSSSTSTTINGVVLGSTTRNSSTSKLYTVSLDANGGTCDTTSFDYIRTTTYTFKSWNTKQNGNGTSYSSTASVNVSTVYAQWNENNTYTKITLPTPVREGYTFKGWALDKSDNFGVTGDYTPTSNVTLYAIWALAETDYTLYLGTQKISKIYLGEQEVKFCVPR